MAYRRSHTLSTLPTNLVAEVEQESEEENMTERSKLITQTASPVRSSGSMSDLDSQMSSNIRESTSSIEKGHATRKKPATTKRSVSSASCLAGKTGVSAKSGNGILRSTSGGNADVVQGSSKSSGTAASRSAKRFGRTTSTPAIILNKVKDRIREKMFSGDWPHGAAIIQERRHRSVEAFQARCSKSRRSLEREDLELEQVPLKDINKKKRARMKSDPIPAVVLTNVDDMSPAEAARLAFRRRSISEDTYDRRPCLPKIKLGSPDNSAGIICSNEDLQALSNYGDNPRLSHKRSPQTSKRSSLEPQGSIESSSSTYSSRSAKAFSLDAESPSERPDVSRGLGGDDVPLTGASICAGASSSQYPEVILDKKHKDSLVSRSSSVTSGASGTALSHLSHAGSKSSMSDRRRSGEHKDEDRRRSTEKTHSRTVSRDEGKTEHDDEDDDTPKSVPEVVFDEFGQTWDVYGAEFDPEMLGDAIQRHLTKLMGDLSGGVSGNQQKRRREQEQKVPKAGENVSFLLRFLCLFNSRRQTPSS